MRNQEIINEENKLKEERIRFFNKYFSTDYIEKYYVESYYKENDLAKSVIRNKYFHSIDEDNIAFMWFREAYPIYCKQFEIYKTELYSLKDIYSALEDFKYIFGGRINYALGVPGVNSSFANCYFIGIEEDSLYGIYHSLGRHALTYGKGGGVGTDITILRPTGSKVKGTGSFSPGAHSFMDLYSTNTGTIAQHGRRGACIISINVYHPNSIDFIKEKNDKFYDYIQEISQLDGNLAKRLNQDFSDRRKVSYANVTVKFPDSFMEALEKNEDIQLFFPDIENCEEESDINLINNWKEKQIKYLMCFQNLSYESAFNIVKKYSIPSVYQTRWDGDLISWKEKGLPIKIYQTISAKEIWDEFIKSSHKSAEPGGAYESTVIENWTVDVPFKGFNPCGEILMFDEESCLLGHRNLKSFVENGEFKLQKLLDIVPITVFMQDILHDIGMNRHALNGQTEVSKKFRRIGIGITGLADALIMTKLKYDSDEAIEFCRNMAKEIEIANWKASVELAKKIGSFPSFKKEVFMESNLIQKLPYDLKCDIEKYGVRNAAVSTIAPVGTGSLLCETEGSGIEPLFATSHERSVKNNDGSYRKYRIFPKIVKELFEDDKNLPEYVITSHNIDYKKRIEMQGAWQDWISNSISSTINLSQNAEIKDIDNIYRLSHKRKLKGVTVYRDGSRAGILNITKKDKELPEGHAQKPPLQLPAFRIKRKFEHRKFYFTVSMYEGSPYEVFVTTNAHSSTTDSDKAVDVLVELAQKYKIASSIIEEQKEKSLHQQNTVKVCRLVSLCLRHEIPLIRVVETLLELNMPVTSFIYHLMKVLARWIPEGTETNDEEGQWIWRNGCKENIVTGESKC